MPKKLPDHSTVDGWEPRPGEMHPVDQAFYDLAVKERDYERVRVDWLTASVESWKQAAARWEKQTEREVAWRERLLAEIEALKRDPRGSLHGDKMEIRRLRGENERLREALAELADGHHRTIRGSRLHDPERLDWSECPARSCSLARAALAFDEEVNDG